MIDQKIRTVIVDDEPHARRLIRTLLRGEEDFEVVAECGDGAKAVEAIVSLKPDLVFLDVQMPEADGFDVLVSLPARNLPAVIFVTAYDRYAVRAFEVHALDYLLKPFDDDRFAKALDRARIQVARDRLRDTRSRLEALIGDVRSDRAGAQRLLVKSAGRITFLAQEEIDWIEAAGNYIKIHVGDEIHLMRETMGALLPRLLEDRFVRIHRSAIVNLHEIKEMRPFRKGEHAVFLKSGVRLALSRKYRPAFEKKLGRPL
jgi:two-component system LytT family response regulator